MGQMVFDEAFGKAEHLGQLVGCEPGAGEQINQALPRGALDGRHSASMLRESGTGMQNLFPRVTKGLNGGEGFCQHHLEPRGGPP